MVRKPHRFSFSFQMKLIYQKYESHFWNIMNSISPDELSDGNATRRQEYRERETHWNVTLMTGSSKGSKESSFNCLCYGIWSDPFSASRRLGLWGRTIDVVRLIPFNF